MGSHCRQVESFAALPDLASQYREFTGKTTGTAEALCNLMSVAIDRPDPLRGLLLALAASFFISTNYITGKFGVDGFGPEVFGLVWMTAAACYSLLIVLATGRVSELNLPPKTRRLVVLVGLFTGLQMYLFWSGLELLNPPFAAFLGRFEPALTILLATLFLGERIASKEVGAVVLMIVGGCLSTLGNWDVVGTGTVLTLLACLTMSIQFLIGKAAVGRVHPSILVFYRASIASAMLAVWTFGFGEPDFRVGTGVWAATFLGALLGPCIGYHLVFHSYRYWGVSRSAMLMTLQPLFAMPLALLFLEQQNITGQQLAGGLTIMAGALWLIRLHWEGRRPPKSQGRVGV